MDCLQSTRCICGYIHTLEAFNTYVHVYSLASTPTIFVVWIYVIMAEPKLD